jgi:predicted transcriptional regulator
VIAELMGVSQPAIPNVVKYVRGKIIDKAPLWIRLHFSGSPALNGKQLLVK